MYKRIAAFAIVCAVALCALPPITVRADAIIEPINDFYNQYANYCVGLGRMFAANGDGGSVDVKHRPGTGGNKATIENGNAVFIQYSCLYDGDYWGLISDSTLAGVAGRFEDFFGWVKLSDMLVLYDYVSFEEEHIDEFYEYSGDFFEIQEAGSVIVWQWPGSGRRLLMLSDVDDTYFDSQSMSVDFAYKDGQGREWGFVNYLYGARNAWICITEPANPDMPVFNPPPDPAVWVPGTQHTQIPESGASMLFVIAALVAALIVVTLVLIKVFWKKEGLRNV